MTSCGIFPSGDFRPGSGTKATTVIHDQFMFNCRRTKHILSLEQQLLQVAQEELEETLKTIEADRQKISALQQEQTLTVRQIKNAMSQGSIRAAEVPADGTCPKRIVTPPRRSCVIVAFCHSLVLL